jgi:hypothetical protein
MTRLIQYIRIMTMKLKNTKDQNTIYKMECEKFIVQNILVHLQYTYILS